MPQTEAERHQRIHTSPDPAGGEPRHPVCFLEVSGCSSSGFITAWSLFHGGVCEAVIGSRWGGPCVPPWWCQPWLRERHGGMGVGGGREGWWWWCVWKAGRLSAGLQVGRLAATQSSHVYQMWGNNLLQKKKSPLKHLKGKVNGMSVYPTNTRRWKL